MVCDMVVAWSHMDVWLNWRTYFSCLWFSTFHEAMKCLLSLLNWALSSINFLSFPFDIIIRQNNMLCISNLWEFDEYVFKSYQKAILSISLHLKQHELLLHFYGLNDKSIQFKLNIQKQDWAYIRYIMQHYNVKCCMQWQIAYI